MSGLRIVPSNFAGVVAVEAQTDHVFGRHIHDRFGVGLIERGAQKSASNRGIVEAATGDTITVSPGEVHDGIPIGGDGRAWRMLYLDPELVLSLAGDINEGRRGRDEFDRPVLTDTHLAGTFRALYGAVTNPEPIPPPLQQESLLLGVIAPLLGDRIDPPPPGAPDVFTRLRDWIAADPAAALTLADLAAESGLSRFQVVRGFKQAFGLAPHAYLVQCRLNLARRRIESDQPLADVAIASGFTDQSHMTRYFAKHFGLPPGAFRRVRQ